MKNSTFATLLQDEYVLQKERRYSFRVNLYRRWVRHDHSIWQVKKEIGARELARITKQARLIKEKRKKAFTIVERSIVAAVLVVAIIAFSLLLIESKKQVLVKANAGPFKLMVGNKLYGASQNAEDSRTFEIKKRRSYRIAIEPITRAELGYSYGFFNIAFGIGTTLVLTKELGSLIGENIDSGTEFFNDLLIFVRAQRMRKNIKRLTAGLYVEFALYSEDFFSKNVKPAKALSIGPILSHTYPSRWELGSSFEVARLNFGRSSSTRFSATYKSESVKLTYGNFEIYLRKWF